MTVADPEIFISGGRFRHASVIPYLSNQIVFLAPPPPKSASVWNRLLVSLVSFIAPGSMSLQVDVTSSRVLPTHKSELFDRKYHWYANVLQINCSGNIELFERLTVSYPRHILPKSYLVQLFGIFGFGCSSTSYLIWLFNCFDSSASGESYVDETRVWHTKL